MSNNIVEAWKNYKSERESLSQEEKGNRLMQICEMKIDNKQFKDSVQECQQIKEESILELGRLMVKEKDGGMKIQELIVKKGEILGDLSKTKMAKVIRQLIDLVSEVKGSEDIQVGLCEYLVDWCKREKRTYLRQRVEIKLANLLGEQGHYQRGLQLTEGLTKEVRKSDDKHLLVEVQLAESVIHFKLRNLAKAKAALTASRACANQIYCPLGLQAEIDKMNGVLLAEDKDYKTAYSYFYESFEAFNSLDEFNKALLSLKYMFLAKIMTGQVEDVNSLYSGKYGLKYQGVELESVHQVAQASHKKSLPQFQQVLQDFQQQIQSDPVISHHIQTLYDSLLESNLAKVIKPYSKVQLTYVATLVNLPLQFVLNKLSEMILDKKITGTLDQGNGCLIIFDELPSDNLYANSLLQMNAMNKVIDQLFEKSKLLKA